VNYATSTAKSGWGGRRPGAGRKPIHREQRLRKRVVYLTDPEWEACTCNAALGVKPEEYIRHLVQHARTIRKNEMDNVEERQEQPNSEGEIEL
jgi:hypothetical protein